MIHSFLNTSHQIGGWKKKGIYPTTKWSLQYPLYMVFWAAEFYDLYKLMLHQTEQVLITSIEMLCNEFSITCKPLNLKSLGFFLSPSGILTKANAWQSERKVPKTCTKSKMRTGLVTITITFPSAVFLLQCKHSCFLLLFSYIWVIHTCKSWLQWFNKIQISYLLWNVMKINIYVVLQQNLGHVSFQSHFKRVAIPYDHKCGQHPLELYIAVFSHGHPWAHTGSRLFHTAEQSMITHVSYFSQCNSNCGTEWLVRQTQVQASYCLEVHTWKENR